MATAQELVRKSEEEIAKMLWEQTMLLKAEIDGEGHPEPDGDEAEATPEAPPEGTEDATETAAPAPEGMEGGDGDSMPTVEELVAEFQQMSPEHLELFKQAIAQVQGSGSEGSPEATPPTPEMGKSEMSLKLQAAKELRLAAEALNKREGTPAKPIRTTPRVAPKAPPKSLSKGEVHDRLLTLSKSASTKDSDRQAINQYYSKGDLSAVKHLLG